MAKIRSIKPEFWVSPQISNCSLGARLLFIGLWTFCDDHGVHPVSKKCLKMEVFPGDNFTEQEIGTWMDELIHNKLVTQYESDGEYYWHVTGWKKHQRITKPYYKHPKPPLTNDYAQNSSIPPVVQATPEPLPNHTQTIPGVHLKHPGNGNGDENGNGNGKEICQVANATSPRSSESSTGETQDEVKTKSPPKVACSKEVEEIFNHWVSTMGHPRAKLDKERQRAVEKALKLGYSIDDLKQAINGCAKTPFNMGENNRQQRYDHLSLILRDAEHIEGFLATSHSMSSSSTGHTQNSIFAGAI